LLPTDLVCDFGSRSFALCAIRSSRGERYNPKQVSKW
jgi:hypothetical protein